MLIPRVDYSVRMSHWLHGVDPCHRHMLSLTQNYGNRENPGSIPDGSWFYWNLEEWLDKLEQQIPSCSMQYVTSNCLHKEHVWYP